MTDLETQKYLAMLETFSKKDLETGVLKFLQDQQTILAFINFLCITK